MKDSTLIRVVLIGVVTVAISCEAFNSDDVNQQKIFTSYYLKYDADLNETHAYATFKFGSNYLKLKDPAYVSFKYDKMIKSDILGFVSYDLVYRGLMNSGLFYYQDADGNEYQNNVVVVDPISFSDSFSSLSISDGGELFWDGPVISAGQSVSFTIYNDETNFLISTIAIGANSIAIQENEIPEELKGNVNIKVCRSKSTDADESPEKGGTIFSEFCAEEAKLTITD